MRVAWARSALVGAMLVVASCDDEPTPSTGGGDAAVIDEGRLPSGDDGSEGCVLDGYACGDAGECCSGACSEGLCGTGEACLEAGATCTTRDQCCTRTCTSSICTGTANEPSPPSCINDDAVCDGGTPCCDRQCTAGYCSTCPESIGPGACNACIANACCDTVGQCVNDPSCFAFLVCVVSCGSEGGTGFDCALGACAVDADAFTTKMAECYAGSCTAQCHGP